MIWREDETWYMLLASRIKDIGGSVFLYRSPDLMQWKFLYPLVTGSYAKDGCVWECPSFFPLGDKWVLIVAGKGRRIPFTVFYFIGDYVDHQFKPESSGIRLIGSDHMLEIGGAYLDIEVEFNVEDTVELAVACAPDGGKKRASATIRPANCCA